MNKEVRRVLDPTDIKILGILQQDARLEGKQIGVLVHKSASPVNERIRRLQELGYIKRYVAILDRDKIGRPLLMITLVRLNGHQAKTLTEFPAYMYTLPEVQVCLHLSGEFDFLLQITIKDPQEYQEFLETKLCNLPMVEKVQSTLVLKECKMEAAIPLG